MRELFSKLSKIKFADGRTKPAYSNGGCENCNRLKSDIANLLGKVIAKDIEILNLVKSSALKDEVISRLQNEQKGLKHTLSLKEERISSLEEQLLQTDTKINKLWAEFEFVWKEFEGAVKINQEVSDDSDGSPDENEEEARLPPTTGKANSDGDSLPPKEENILVAAPSGHDEPPPYSSIIFSDDSPPSVDESMAVAVPSSHDKPPPYLSIFNDDSRPPRENNIAEAALTSHDRTLPPVMENRIPMAAPSSYDRLPSSFPTFNHNSSEVTDENVILAAHPTIEEKTTVTAAGSHAAGKDGKVHISDHSLYDFHRPPTPYRFYKQRKPSTFNHNSSEENVMVAAHPIMKEKTMVAAASIHETEKDGKVHISDHSLYGFRRPPTPFRFYRPRTKAQ